MGREEITRILWGVKKLPAFYGAWRNNPHFVEREEITRILWGVKK